VLPTVDGGIQTQVILSTYSTPKLGIVTSGNHSSLAILAQSSSYEIECSNEFLAIAGVQSIFWRFAHGDNEDVAIVAIERKIGIVNYRSRHVWFPDDYLMSDVPMDVCFVVLDVASG
jgi:hypothetical protein